MPSVSTKLTLTFHRNETKKVVASNGSASCALLRDGTLQCWGANESGQLGDGAHETRYVPVRPKR